MYIVYEHYVSHQIYPATICLFVYLLTEYEYFFIGYFITARLLENSDHTNFVPYKTLEATIVKRAR